MLPFALAGSGGFYGCKKKEKPVPPGTTAIIVGAGISGLAAAVKLKQRGYTVLILESRNRSGGRIFTNRTLGIPFDEGASWIHGPKGNPLTDIAKKAGATTFRTDDDSVQVFDMNGSRIADSVLDSVENQYNQALNTVANNGGKDLSFEAVFNQMYPGNLQNRLWKYMLSAYLEFDSGADISRLSSLFFYDDEEFKGEDVILTNGFDQIIQYLASGLDIRYQTPVSEIDFSSEKVIVKAGNQTFEGDYVLCTVPLGVLKNNLIAFNPALPAEKFQAIATTEMGCVNKFLLTWNEPFWPVGLQYIGYTPETKGMFNYFLNLRKFSSANGLMTFAFGNYAIFTETMSDSEVTALIMQHLRAIYGSSIPDPEQLLRTRWNQDIHSFGSYSYATVGGSSADFDKMAQSVNNRLFFAGEHTNRAYRGTVHGAYLSGLREADKIYQVTI